MSTDYFTSDAHLVDAVLDAFIRADAHPEEEPHLITAAHDRLCAQRSWTEVARIWSLACAQYDAMKELPE